LTKLPRRRSAPRPPRKIPSRRHHSGKQARFRWPPPYHPRRTRRPPGKGRGKKPLNQNQNNSTSECLSCRKMGHPRSQCKFRNYTCHTCGRSNHITDACKSKSQKIHSVEEPYVSQLDPPSDPFSLSLQHQCREQWHQSTC